MARDLTRADLRAIVGKGLMRTAWNYKAVVQLFNMASGDYRRFLSFLRKHGCQVPVPRSKVPRAAAPPDAEAER
jgi:hypothetical protein